MKRVILGSLLGYTFFGLTTAVSHQLLYARILPLADSPRAPYWAAITATDFALAVLGGWLCAMVSLKAPKATLVLIMAGEATRVVLSLLLWSAVANFYNLFEFIAYPPAVWLGAVLGSRIVPNILKSLRSTKQDSEV